MTPSNTYTATCWREGSSWVVRVPELDRTTRTARFSQVEGVARGMVARISGSDGDSARVVIDLLVPDGLLQLLDAAAAARQDRDRVSVEAVTLRRGLARRLAAEGFAVRDVAALLGLSIARAQQLIGEGSRPSPLAATRSAQPEQTEPTGQSPAAVNSTRPTASTPLKPHVSYRHEAFLYRGEDDFLAGTVPFLLEAISLGQPVIVGVTPHRLKQLQAELGSYAPGVHFVDLAALGANPARIIPALRSFVDDFSGPSRPVRAVGEPVWPGRRATEIAESQLHEALLNVSVEPDTPFWLRCLYDADALAAPVIEEASRSHPSLHEGEHYRGSTSYGGVHHAEALFHARLPEPPPQTHVTSFGPVDLPNLGPLVTRYATTAGLVPGRITDLVRAVTEVATNSIRHGGGGGLLRLWQDGDALSCEITDTGHITDSLVGRRTPMPDIETGRGLWLANQLCDLLQIRSGPEGTTVRMLTWL